jgi:hypothetical protein
MSKDKKIHLVYIGQPAKNILDNLDNYFEGKGLLLKLPLPIVGMFRKDPRQWTCFILYQKENEHWLEISTNLQHEGDCVKILNQRLESEGYKKIPISRK